MVSDETGPQRFDASTKRRVMIVMVIGAGIAFLDSSIANVALPAIQRDLGISTALQQWVASGYLLTLSALLLVGGRLADVLGRRRLLRAGLALYAFFAVLAGLSPNGPALVAARALQGVAGAMLVPTTLAIISAVYEPGERGRAIGTWAAWSGITTILGPILGGLVIDNLSWRYAFFITPAVAAIAFTLSRPVPESGDAGASSRIDYPGVALVAAALGGIVFALIQGPVAGWDSPFVIGTGVSGAALLLAFVWWERRAEYPVLPRGLFADRDVGVANVVTLFVYAGLYGSSFYTTLYLQSTLDASATLAGALFVPVTVVLFVLSPYAGRLNDRYGPRWLLCFGPLGAAAGIAVMATTGPGEIWTVLLPGILLFAVGLGFTVAPVTATAIGSADERYSGVASGFNNAVSRIAGLFAIAFMGVVVVQLWQVGLSAPSEVEPTVRDALSAVSTQAFVVPDTAGEAPSVAAAIEERATRAGVEAFRSGMLLAAALVALGGLVAAAGITPRAQRSGSAPA